MSNFRHLLSSDTIEDSHTTGDNDRENGWVFDQGVSAGPAFQFKGYNGEIPTIGKIATMKISSDKSKGILRQFLQLRSRCEFSDCSRFGLFT